MSGAILLPIISAVLHPVLGWFVQGVKKRGGGMLVTTCVSNLVGMCIFLLYLRPNENWIPHGWDWFAIISGVCFFMAQWCCVLALSDGDLPVHSAVMGSKIFIVGAMSIALMLENFSYTLVLAVIIATFAIFLVAGATWEGVKRHKKTVYLTLGAAFFFAVADILIVMKGQEVGKDRFLSLLMLTNGLVSTVVLVTRFDKFRSLIRGDFGVARWCAIGAGLTMGVQALLFNLALVIHQLPVVSNVAYGTRSVTAIIWIWIFGSALERSQPARRFLGSVLVVVALWLALK